ncbi:MAG: hypothetical protein LBB20_03730 [Puniceicoccales bacterium]|jgi:hypothetical protein|nr:hypothetical protein [Puniceicoccales bacterium]
MEKRLYIVMLLSLCSAFGLTSSSFAGTVNIRKICDANNTLLTNLNDYDYTDAVYNKCKPGVLTHNKKEFNYPVRVPFIIGDGDSSDNSPKICFALEANVREKTSNVVSGSAHSLDRAAKAKARINIAAIYKDETKNNEQKLIIDVNELDKDIANSLNQITAGGINIFDISLYIVAQRRPNGNNWTLLPSPAKYAHCPNRAYTNVISYNINNGVLKEYKINKIINDQSVNDVFQSILLTDVSGSDLNKGAYNVDKSSAKQYKWVTITIFLLLDDNKYNALTNDLRGVKDRNSIFLYIGMLCSKYYDLTFVFDNLSDGVVDYSTGNGILLTTPASDGLPLMPPPTSSSTLTPLSTPTPLLTRSSTPLLTHPSGPSLVSSSVPPSPTYTPSLSSYSPYGSSGSSYSYYSGTGRGRRRTRGRRRARGRRRTRGRRRARGRRRTRGRRGTRGRRNRHW